MSVLDFDLTSLSLFALTGALGMTAVVIAVGGLRCRHGGKC
ncbi:hypothetical protein [Ancylobacter gelatini]|nr:hypothetical protein [Ancylobacter gelatini]